MALFVHSKLESRSDHMYLICFVIVIMAGFDVTVISSSSDDDNYEGLCDCVQKLAGEISDKSSLEGGMQPVKPSVEPGPSNFPISKTANTLLTTSNSMASSSSPSEQLIHVSFMNFNVL